MNSIVLVGKEAMVLDRIAKILKQDSGHIHRAETGVDTLSLIDQIPVDLVIIDENIPDAGAKELIKQILEKNCLINCAVVSQRSKKEFHDHFEGYGVLCQLSTQTDLNLQLTQLLSQVSKIVCFQENIKPASGGSTQ